MSKTTTMFTVVLRGGRTPVRVSASSKYQAETIVRMWAEPALYPIWYILSQDEVSAQNPGRSS